MSAANNLQRGCGWNAQYSATFQRLQTLTPLSLAEGDGRLSRTIEQIMHEK